MSPSRSTPLGITETPTHTTKTDDLEVGLSYTDRREGEEVDLLKRIVDMTASNLIDMYNPNPGQLNQDEAHLDFATLKRNVHERKVTDLSILEGLPRPSSLVSGSVVDVLSEPGPRDLAAVKKSGEALRSALVGSLHASMNNEVVVKLDVPAV